MNHIPLRTVIATMAVVLVLGGCRAAGPSGGPGSSPVSSPPQASADPIVALPNALWGDWHAEVTGLQSVTSVAQAIRVSFDWQDGRGVWVQLDGEGRQLLHSSPLSAPAGEMRLKANQAGAPCAVGDEGRYRWSRSPDGLFLTIELIDDPCAARGAVLARTWVHSLSAVSDGGVGVVPNDPWIEVTLPKERFAMGGGTAAADIHSFDDSTPFKALIVVKDPMGFRAPCEADRQPFDLEPSIRAFSDYAHALPGMQLEDRRTTIDGLDALIFNVAVQPEFPCPTGEPGVFRSSVPTETDATWGYGPGDSWFMSTLVKDGSLYVFTWENHAGVEAAEAKAVFESIRFFDTLPTP